MRQAGEGVETLGLALDGHCQRLARNMGKGYAMAGAALGIKHVVLQPAHLRQA